MNAEASTTPAAPHGLHTMERDDLRTTLARVAKESVARDPRGRAAFREFLSILGHELRNPLAPLQNAIYILEQADLESSGSMRLLEMMNRQVQALTHLVDDLLDASRNFDESRGTRQPSDGAEADATRVPGPKRVLVVDDNVDAAESLAELLRLHGCEAHLASSAAAALEQSAKHPFDAVVLDIGLPDRDGYSLARQLRARPEGENYLLIALTGFGQDEDRQRSEEAGIDHHLTKPIEIAHLLALIADEEGNQDARTRKTERGPAVN